VHKTKSEFFINATHLEMTFFARIQMFLALMVSLGFEGEVLGYLVLIPNAFK
jgi:hypothetical protein